MLRFSKTDKKLIAVYWLPWSVLKKTDIDTVKIEQFGIGKMGYKRIGHITIQYECHHLNDFNTP
jgi:hypothetical protein